MLFATYMSNGIMQADVSSHDALMDCCRRQRHRRICRAMTWLYSMRLELPMSGFQDRQVSNRNN